MLYDGARPAGAQEGGKTGPSTDAEVLEKLAEKHPLPRALLEYRTLSKLKSTYLDALVPLVAADGRLHTTFHQAATATGPTRPARTPTSRTSPCAPSMGRRHPPGLRRRAGLEAGLGGLQPDRAAHPGPRRPRTRAWSRPSRRDEDVHQRTAAEVFGVSPGEVTAEQRRVAKMVNFGIAYGLSPHGLSTRLDIPQRGGARRSSTATSPATPASAATSRRRWRGPRRTGCVETLFGRRRLMDDLHSQQPGHRPGRRAGGDQHAHPGHRRRPDQDGDAPHRPPARRARAPHAGCCSRSTTSCSSRRPRGGRACGGPRPDGDDGGGPAAGSAGVEVGVGQSWADAH